MNSPSKAGKLSVAIVRVNLNKKFCVYFILQRHHVPPQMKQLYITVLLSIVVVGCGKKTQNMAIGNDSLKEAKESKPQQAEELLHQLHDSILEQTKTINALESQVNQFNSRLIEIEEALKQKSDKNQNPAKLGLHPVQLKTIANST